MKHAVIRLALCCLVILAMAGGRQTQAFPAEPQDNRPPGAVPMLTGLNQISANQLQIAYDQPVDPAKGVTPANYWVQSITEIKPSGIATLGKNDTVNANNALTPGKVAIRAADNSGQRFILTFNQNITKGKTYKLIICYVTKPGAPPYNGDNGSAVFIGR